MILDPDQRAQVMKTVVVSSLTALGLFTGQGLVGLATTISGDWASTLAAEGLERWCRNWFSDHGVLNTDIQSALSKALEKAVAQLETEWPGDDWHHDGELSTKQVLHQLREDATSFLQNTEPLRAGLTGPGSTLLLRQDEAGVRQLLDAALDTYFFGHNPALVAFVKERLAQKWLLCFYEVLKDRGQEGTRAWRAYQLLWQTSLNTVLDQLGQTGAETLRRVSELEKMMDRLIEEVREALRKLASVPSPLAPFRLPYQRNQLFVGREDALHQLDALLAPERAVLAISGLGGLGKTQLAVQWAYRAWERGDFPGGVFWVQMDAPEGIATQVAAFAGPTGLNLPGWDPAAFEQNCAAVQEAWKQPIARLLVFDNLNPEDLALLKKWRPQVGGCRVLITSRLGRWPANTDVVPLDLPVLERLASRDLLLHPLAQARRTSVLALLDEAETVAVADAICVELGDLPLALALAAAYLESYSTLPLARYLEQVREQATAHRSLNWELETDLPTEHAPNIVATFALSYNRLQPDDPRAAPARTLLHRAAWLAPAPISRRLLLRIADLDPINLEAEIAATDILRQLERVGLIAMGPDGAVLHRLLAAYIRERAATTAAEDIAAVERALLAEIEPLNEAQNPAPAAPHLPHLRLAAQRVQKRADRQAAHLLNQVGLLLFYQGDYTAARTLLEQAVVMHKQVCGLNDPRTAESSSDLAVLLEALEKYVDARELFEQALDIFEEQRGPTHRDTLRVRNNLGAVLYRLKEYTAALPLFEQALVASREQYGADHLETAPYLNNLAGVLVELGKYEQAYLQFEQAYNIYERTFGINHPLTARSLNNMGFVRYKEKNYEAARTLHERALAIREQVEVCGPNHLDTAQSLNNLAEVLEAQGEYGTARPLYERALNIRTEVLGPENPGTQAVAQNLARLRQVPGESGEAAES